MHLRRLTLSLLLCSGLAALFVIGRFLATGQRVYWLIAPNLLLAWVPYWAALLLHTYRSRLPTWGRLGLGALWLAFLPNAPYIVTDFVHLTNLYGGVPIQFDIALLALVAVTGLVLGFASMAIVQAMLPNRWLGWLFATGAWVLVSVGLYVGRVERWNSWDLLHSPGAIIESVLAIPTKPEALALVGSYSLVLPALYLLYRQIGRT